MIMSFKQRKIKSKQRKKLNHNIDNKMLLVNSLAHKPISYFYYQECAGMYANMPMHTAEIWKKMYRVFLFPENIFLVKLG